MNGSALGAFLVMTVLEATRFIAETCLHAEHHYRPQNIADGLPFHKKPALLSSTAKIRQNRAPTRLSASVFSGWRVVMTDPCDRPPNGPPFTRADG